MGEWSANNSAERATQVWARLAGCFGESLIRRFGDEPPEEWVGAISRLNDYQLQQGMRRVVFSGKGAAPSLPEFVKLCRTVGEVDGVEDEAPTPPSHRLPHDEQFDKWAIAANQHLLAYILRKLRDRRTFNEAETRILVRFKNLWAEQMRLSATIEGVPIEEQREVWAECIRRAEAQISDAAKPC